MDKLGLLVMAVVANMVDFMPGETIEITPVSGNDLLTKLQARLAPVSGHALLAHLQGKENSLV